MNEESTYEPRISVPMVTFQHAALVGQALESVLAQDESDWEILLADDQSTDGTIDVVRQYLPRCEWQGRQRLRILPHGQKFGRRQNYLRALAACQGTYVAQLDGDDFLVSAQSLRLRAEFLDRQSTFSLVYSAWYETDEGGEPIGPAKRRDDGRRRFTFADFGPYCLCTSSAVMFRNRLFDSFPAWYADSPVGDWPLHVLNALHGEVGFLNDVLAVHRNHESGVWSSADELQQLRMSLAVQSHFVRDLPAPFAGEMAQRIVPFNVALLHTYAQQGRLDLAMPLLEWCEAFGKPLVSKRELREVRKGLTAPR